MSTPEPAVVAAGRSIVAAAAEQSVAESPTLAAAELLLTKLQIAEIGAKDLSDAAMLLWDHDPASSDGPGRLNVTRLAATCAADWGLFTTVTETSAPAPACSAAW